jgi:CRP/FNR family cyclic AMP-dependent transcriptional regulator
MNKLPSQTISAYWFDEACQFAKSELLEKAKTVKLKNNEFLLRQGDVNDSVYLLQEGRLASAHFTEDGEQFTIRIIHPGQSMGEIQLSGDVHITNSIRSLGASTMLQIKHSDLLSVAKTHPEILIGLTKSVSVMLSNTVKMLNLVILSPLKQRVRWRLLTEALDGEPIDEDWRQVRISQTELSKMVGASRQAVNQELKQLSEAGIVTLAYRCMNIHLNRLNNAWNLQNASQKTAP